MTDFRIESAPTHWDHADMRRAQPAPLVRKESGLTGLQEFVASLATEFLNLPPHRIDPAIQDALRRIGQLADADRAYVFAIAGDRMSNTHEWCGDGAPSRIEALADVPISDYRLCMSHILSRDVLHVPRVRDLPETEPEKKRLMENLIHSVLAVPILLRSKVAGFVGFDVLDGEKYWSDEIIALLKIAAAIFGGAMARQEAESALLVEKEFFSNVVETMGSLVIVLAPNGECLRVNRAFSELTGLGPHELTGHGWQRAIPEEARSSARDALRSALCGKPTQFEGRLRTRMHEERTILWNGAVIRGVAGRQPQYVVVTGIDLTETLALRAEVEQARRIDSLGRVAATIAHEFNNVLMSIQPSANAIRRHPERMADVQRCAERIERAVGRGVRITAEVTRFARPAELIRQEVDVVGWFRGIVEEMQPVLYERAAKPAILLIEPATGRRPVVAADATQLHQVFSNLILNAADAMPGGGTIKVSIDELASHERLPQAAGSEVDRWLHCSVSDTGLGISPMVLDRIFEPLFTTKKRGTGLGLAVAHQVIKAHGGELSVQTELGNGTTFHVFIPLVSNAERDRHE